MSQEVVHGNCVTQSGFTMIPNNVMLRPSLSCSAKLIYGYLKHLAWRNGSDQATSPRDAIENDLGISKKQVTAFIGELSREPVVEGGDPEGLCLVTVKRRGQGLPNLYIINDPETKEVDFGRSSQTALLESPERPFPNKEQELQPRRGFTPTKDVGVKQKASVSNEQIAEVRDAWLLSKNLIAHRLSYFQDPVTRRAILKSVREYGCEDVCGAIASYATIVASDKYWFNYRWTLVDFLRRGLPRFVREAEPERNFLRENNGFHHNGAPAKPAPKKFPCPHCVTIGFDSEKRLGKHLENVHGLIPAEVS